MATTRTVRLLQRRTEQISFLNELTTGDAFRPDDPDAPPWFQEEKIHEVKYGDLPVPRGIRFGEMDGRIQVCLCDRPKSVSVLLACGQPILWQATE